MQCNSQNNDLYFLIIDDGVKYHDGDGTFNMIDNLYEKITPIITKIKSYKKYKHVYIIGCNRYDMKAIKNILDVYDIFRSLINIVKNSYPDDDDNYTINNVAEIVTSIEKLKEFSRMISHDNITKVEHVKNNLITDDHIALDNLYAKFLNGSNTLTYREIKKLICILYYIAINL